SFDAPTMGMRIKGGWIDVANRWLPSHRAIKKRPPMTPNILVIGATNRAADLDPALLRPGRFDRSIHFDVPSRTGRREIIDYYLGRKAHESERGRRDRREPLAAMTAGYSPVMSEHLFDEGLVWALRDGRPAMTWADVQQAKFTEEIGLKQPVEYTDGEKRRIATHEGGHAVVAHLVSDRNLEVLSIIKRRGALGLLAHSDAEERFTRTEDELKGLMAIAFGGMVAEELSFGAASTGPAGDLSYATALAAQMVGSFGMGGTLISFEAVEAGPLAAGIVAKVLANDDARKRVEVLLLEAKETARRLLAEHRHLLEPLVAALLERNELVGDEITDVLERAGVGYATFAMLLGGTVAVLHHRGSKVDLTKGWDKLGTRGGLLIGALLFVAYLLGGYVAGRMAWRRGIVHGLGVFVGSLVVVGAVALLVRSLAKPKDVKAITDALSSFGVPTARADGRDVA